MSLTRLNLTSEQEIKAHTKITSWLEYEIRQFETSEGGTSSTKWKQESLSI